jgi:hypothetical protein
MGSRTRYGRARVERGIYLQSNGKYAVCCRHAGRLRFRTVGGDLQRARSERAALIRSARRGVEPGSPRLRFGTVAGWWLDRFEAKVAVGERHPRTLEAHRYQLERNLLPTLAARRIDSITVDDVAQLLVALQRERRSPKTSAAALATLHSVLHHARRRSWTTVDPVAQLERDERPQPCATPPARARAHLARHRLHRREDPCARSALSRVPRVARYSRASQDARLQSRHPAGRTARWAASGAQAGNALRS